MEAGRPAGLAFDAAFENEFYLAVLTDEGYRPVDQTCALRHRHGPPRT
jgi:hypothetical protein